MLLRVTVRLTQDDHDKLTELRLALHCDSQAETLRALIRLHHDFAQRNARSSLRRARKARTERDAVQQGDTRTLPLFGGKA